MQEKLFQKCTYFWYCSVLSLGGKVDTRRMSQPNMESIFTKMIYEIFWSKKTIVWIIKILSKLNALFLLDTRQILMYFVYQFRPERTGFNMHAEYTQLQLTFLALVPCIWWSKIAIPSIFLGQGGGEQSSPPPPPPQQGGRVNIFQAPISNIKRFTFQFFLLSFLFLLASCFLFLHFKASPNSSFDIDLWSR